jgi:ubiquinone/menaquinone biosynthesis C-methylase UbiE
MTFVEDLKNQTREAYNWLAEDYAREWASKADQVIIERFVTLVPECGRVLDVGCGPAHYAKAFSEYGFATIGIDLSAGMLAQAQMAWRRACLAQMDMSAMGFQSNSFDALWACSSFTHVPESSVTKTLAEFNRLLKSGGILFINAAINSTPLRIEAMEEIAGYHKEGRFFQRYQSEQHFVGYLVKAEFGIVDIISRTVYSGYDTGAIVSKDEYKINRWVNFYCRKIAA